jgi:predicted transcriptional regulator
MINTTTTANKNQVNSPTPATVKIDADAIRAEFETLTSSIQIDEIEDEAKNESNKTSFPVLSDKALSGLSGDIVRTIEPHTEADNAALLIQFLAGFGSLIGKTAHFQVGADKHFTKINAVIVGASSRARKGTSWSEIERLLIRVDESFRDCIQNGLSSGEGLIYHVRDERTEKRPIKTKGIITSYQDEIVDEGATEKRAFVIEPEFARVLQSMKREGNTLSSVIRQAWDTDRLRVMTKNPVSATEAHVSIVGHITEIELIRNLDETESANGFANRFNWICARRSKYLPDGGNLAENDLNEAVRCLNEAVQFARKTEQIKRDAEANQLWHQVYKRLSDGYGGLLGSVTSRATAQVIRLACLYALLDCSDIIRLEHLEAALAVWQYCEDSAKYIFGMSSGDKVADEIFTALKSSEAGLSKTEISNHFNRNRTAKEIETALQTLLELERVEKAEEKTQGRTKEIFRVTATNLTNLTN